LKKFWDYLPYLLLIIAFCLLIIHTINIQLFDFLRIDEVSIFLIVVIIVILLIPYIRKIKYKDLEVDIEPSEVKKLNQNFYQNIPLSKSPTDNIENRESPEISQQILSLVETDHILALAKLRIEIEKGLKGLNILTSRNTKKDANNVRSHNFSNSQLLNNLKNQGILSANIANDLRTVLNICNRAIHGESIREKDAKTIVNIGVDSLLYLANLQEEYMIKPNDEQIISSAELEKFETSRYKVTSIIPYVENPKKITRIIDQDGLDVLLDNYNEYAEFLVSIEKIEDESS